jgi:hypothetical protein
MKGGAQLPLRVVEDFAARIPGRSLRFFQRQYFVDYPRPIQQSGTAPFPRRVRIAELKLPDRQSLVLRSVSFQAYQHSGIGIDDLDVVPAGRAVGTLGFEFKMGNQGLMDYQSNQPGSGVVAQYSLPQSFGPTAPRVTQGGIIQGLGKATPGVEANQLNWAAYGMPGQLITADAVVFRPPSYDVRVFEVSFGGWLMEQTLLEKLIDSL